MEAPKPITILEESNNIEKEIKSEQGNNYFLQITLNKDKFNFQVKKKDKNFEDIYMNEYTMNQIQENQYFKMFSSPDEILEELKEKINSKNPILNECQNQTIELVIFLQNSKFKQIEFYLTNKGNKSIDSNYENLKSIIENLNKRIEKLENENKEIKQENKEIKEK